MSYKVGPTSYKWSYGAPINGLIFGFSWGYFTLLIGVKTQFITGRGPTFDTFYKFVWVVVSNIFFFTPISGNDPI